jgi:hypothetical protein
MALTRIGNQAITLDAAEIPNLDAAKITSGQFADARIAASNVSQHATSFDDNKIVNDISTLGLRVHTQENLSASNTNSASFDTFQDSSGITGLTNVQRSTSEYMSSAIQGSTNSYQTTALDSNYMINFNMNYFSATNFLLQTGYGGFIITPVNYEKGWGYNMQGDSDFGANFHLTQVSWWNQDTSSRFKFWKLQSSSDGNTWTDETMNCGGASTGTGVTIGTASNTTAVNTGSPVTPFTGYFRIMYDDGYHGDQYAGAGRLIISGYGFTTSATGSFEGNPITASSTNKMGAVITYQDHAGTNALNTDIILKLSANNGSSYSTATLTALPDFATGIKMCKVNDVSVTAGTQLKYKIEFANQASGSKEARIRGVSLQY